MNYRDDREALRAEVDSLQQELSETRADEERLRQIEQRLEATKQEMQALEAELGRARSRTKRGGARIVLPVVLVAMVAAGAGAFLLLARGPSPAPIAAPAVPPPPVPPPPPAKIPEPPPIPEEPAPAAAPAPRREAVLRWSATVTRSTDPALRAGAPCRIDAKAVPDKSGMHVIDVKVTCGARPIYDENGRLNGTSMLDTDASQRPGAKAGTWVYELAFSDVGARSATRNQAQLDSAKKIGKVWSENLPEMRVDLAIKSGSEPVEVAILEPER